MRARRARERAGARLCRDAEGHRLLDSFADPAAARAKTLALHPGGRIATAREIALAAVFMISDECPFMNAATLVVDGGLSQLQHPA